MSPEPTCADLARELLLYKMRECSQERFCASWLDDLESELWILATGAVTGAVVHDAGGFPRSFYQNLHQLALIADGWWIWMDDSDKAKSGPAFISLAGWEALRRRRDPLA